MRQGFLAKIRRRLHSRRLTLVLGDLLAWYGPAVAIHLAAPGHEGRALHGFEFAVALGLLVLPYLAGAHAVGLYRHRHRLGIPNPVVAAAVFGGGATVFLLLLNAGMLGVGRSGPFGWGGLVVLGSTATGLMIGIRLVEREVGFRRKRARRTGDARWPLHVALPIAEELRAELEGCDAVVVTNTRGSVRRMGPTVGDIDLLAASDQPADVVDAFVRRVREHRVTKVEHAQDDAKVAGVTSQGIPFSVRIVLPAVYGSALLDLTGSLRHHLRVRAHALLRGQRLSWGRRGFSKDNWVLLNLTTVRRSGNASLETEEEAYGRLGIPWIHPTLREGRGEVEAALAGRLPRVVKESDIRGDLHLCSSVSEGNLGVRGLVASALARGYRFVACVDSALDFLDVPDPSQRLARRKDEFQSLRTEVSGRISLLHGLEVNLDSSREATLMADAPDAFDLVIARVDSDARAASGPLTERLLRAITDPGVNTIELAGSELHDWRPTRAEMAELCMTAARRRVAIEVGGGPCDWEAGEALLRTATDHGVRLFLSSRGRREGELSGMRFAVGKAQRGWAAAEDVINTWEFARLLEFLDAPGRASRV